MRDIKMPPLPEPNLMDVGSTPRDIKDFLTGYATAYARAAVQANVPDGWVMVPVEPTKEMLKNVFSECGSIGGGSCGEYVGVDWDDICSIWSAMLSAIQKG